MSKLTEKQKIFSDTYLANGFNATQAAITAGLKQPHSQGPRLLENVGVKNYIKTRTQQASNNRIMTVTELKEFWSDTAKGSMTDADYKDRLKASELLGKAEALFVERLKHEGTISISSELNKARERGA